MGKRILIISRQEKETYLYRADELQKKALKKKSKNRGIGHPDTRIRCSACNRITYERMARINGHPGLCKKKCNGRSKGSIRVMEELLSPEERRAARARRKSTRQEKVNYRAQSDAFLKSDAWIKLRYKALVKFGKKCLLCGGKPPDVVLHVDHIKPRYRYPELALKLDNLQVLCASCNFGKGVSHEHDFRPENFFLEGDQS